jgi:putative addiction module killer protein
VPEIRETDTFSKWLRRLKDRQASARIKVRIRQFELTGHPGDVGPVGEGVSEMRFHFGPGYRVYFVGRGSDRFLLLCGGDKSSQVDDVERAKRLAKEED